VDRSRYPEEIKLKVLVVDTAGNFISGLAPRTTDKYATNKYFKKIVEVIERKSAPVKNFSVREISDTMGLAKDISLVFDYSGSMSGTINSLIKSARKFISMKTLRDRISMIVYDDHIATLNVLDNDKSRLLKAFATAVYSDFGQSTSLYAAVDKGLITLQGSANHKMLLLFTDGYENSSFTHSDSLLFTSQDVVAKARKDSVRITTLAFGTDLNTPLLSYLSELTDGNSYNIYRNKDIMKAYKEISLISKHYYEITYKPAVADGNREIRLSCFNQIETIVAKRKMFVGENFLISDWSMDRNKYNYIDSIIIAINKSLADGSANSKKLTPLSVPQAIAFFDFSNYNLRVQDSTTLGYYLAWLKKNSSSRILLLGHTDLKGTDKSCEVLSQRRADEVKTFLENNGIEKNRIFAVACGKRHPVNTQETDEEKAQENRRVEAVLLK
jgi:outer membrane protein OmpA-like peptidoglycan-associated protein